MSVSLVAKVVGGLAMGGAIATPFFIFRESSGLKLEQLSVSERNQIYLEEGFVRCTELLEKGIRRDNNHQIYLCPLGGNNKLELFYFEEKGGQKSSKKIKELEQNFSHSSQHELIVKFEGENDKKISWPSSVFQYTNTGVTAKTTLVPDTDCQITPKGDELFSCNSSWEVIKKR